MGLGELCISSNSSHFFNKKKVISICIALSLDYHTHLQCRLMVEALTDKFYSN